MQSKATSVNQYLTELPPDRRAAIETVRREILRRIDNDVEEGMQYGMIGFYIPHRVYPPGYHCNPKEPLAYVCLASQKNYMAIYLSRIYSSATEEKWFRRAWAKTGKKLDMGKSCIRFKKLEDLALDVIGEAIGRMPAKRFIEYYESVLKDARRRRGGGSGQDAKASKKKPAARKSGKTAKDRLG